MRIRLASVGGNVARAMLPRVRRWVSFSGGTLPQRCPGIDDLDSLERRGVVHVRIGRT